MPRGEQIVRHWNLLKTLQTRGEGLPLKGLSDQFGVAERTIQRDLEILQELGFPISHEADELGKRYWRMPHDFLKTGPLVLSLSEAISLHLAAGMLDPLAGTHLADGLQSLLEKIRSVVPKQALEYFARLDETVYVRRTGTTDYAPHAETIRLIVDAAREETSVNLTYRSLWRGKEYTTLFDPYGLVYYDGDLFVLGRSHRAGAVRIFKVSRIRSAAVTDQAFRRPRDFSVSDHFRSSFGIIPATGEPVEVVVRFTGTVAGLVEERIWHESQRLSWLAPDQTLFDEQPEESETLVASFRLADLVEFKRWVKGFGRNAEVLKPDWLRREMHEELTEAARQYET